MTGADTVGERKVEGSESRCDFNDAEMMVWVICLSPVLHNKPSCAVHDACKVHVKSL